jgi:hypothetical protein
MYAKFAPIMLEDICLLIETKGMTNPHIIIWAEDKKKIGNIDSA